MSPLVYTFIVVGSLVAYVMISAVAYAIFMRFRGPWDDGEAPAAILWPLSLTLIGPLWSLSRLWGYIYRATSRRLSEPKSPKLPKARVHNEFNGQ